MAEAGYTPRCQQTHRASYTPYRLSDCRIPSFRINHGVIVQPEDAAQSVHRTSYRPHSQRLLARSVPTTPSAPSPHCIHARAANDANTGQNGGLSFNAVPAIMQAPAPLAAKQWYTILINGGTSGMPLAILSGVATAYVAYNRAYPSPTLPMSPWQTVQLTIMDRGPAHPPLPPQRRGRPPLSQHRALYTLLHRPDQHEAAGQDARTRSYVAGG